MLLLAQVLGVLKLCLSLGQLEVGCQRARADTVEVYWLRARLSCLEIRREARAWLFTVAEKAERATWALRHTHLHEGALLNVWLVPVR